MSVGFPLLPQQASTISVGVDYLYLTLCCVSTFFILLIFGLIFLFAIKYRRRSELQRARQIPGSLRLEMFWSVIPLAIAMVFYFWGAQIFFTHAQPPDNASVVYVVGKQWMWKLQHPEGNREIDELHIPVGRPIKLVMTSQDVIHSFFIPAFRVKQDVVPGRYLSMWFTATKVGKYHLFCSQYCGTNHAQMIGWVYVMDPVDYQNWLTGGAGAGQPMAVAGEQLFHRLGCATCHVRDCPPLQGLYGRPVRLQDGRTVIADNGYIRESILDPTAKIVAGYRPLMPTFKGQVSEEQVLQLIAYIQSLAGEAPGSVAPATGKEIVPFPNRRNAINPNPVIGTKPGSNQ
jgi:cytochrome c oxidase subunit 2